VTAGMGEQGRAIGGMSARAAALVAWSLCVLSLTLTALSLSLLTLTLFRRVDLDLVMGLDSGHRSRGVPRPAVPRWQVAQRSLAVVRLVQHCCGHSRSSLDSTPARSDLAAAPPKSPLQPSSCKLTSVCSSSTLVEAGGDA
jgi:hypothetical protein